MAVKSTFYETNLLYFLWCNEYAWQMLLLELAVWKKEFHLHWQMQTGEYLQAFSADANGYSGIVCDKDDIVSQNIPS